MAIKLENRIDNAALVQNVLTRYGCFIKTRLGIPYHNEDGSCSNSGLIILEIVNKDSLFDLKNELLQIGDISLNLMEI
ncbi:MAG: hypothetical protein BHW64_02250 [Candidatus Melainabacteria bacterium LEY3_CP_29_8]|nr:MAG: hypothetical protein BHW64_02250 [Candidatus Melainabacteria bacterium LEY3_CP_29_8]